MGPEEALWFRDLEEVANDGKRRVTIPELSSAESVWQQKKKERDAAAAEAAEQEDDKENGITQASTVLQLIRALLTACSIHRTAGQEAEDSW
jgi:predicted nucleic acid-binding protein